MNKLTVFKKQIERQQDNIRKTNEVIKKIQERLELVNKTCNETFEKIRDKVLSSLWEADQLDNLLRKNKYNKEDEEKITNRMRKVARDAMIIQDTTLKEYKKRCEERIKLGKNSLDNFIILNNKRKELLNKLSAKLGKKRIDEGDNKRSKRKSIRKSKSKSRSKRKRKSKSRSRRKRKSKSRSKRKSVSKKYCLTTSPKKMGFSQKASCKAQGFLKRTSKKNKGKYIVSPKYKKRSKRSIR